MKDNFRCICIDMPTSVKGTVAYDSVEDFYTIYINARHSQSQQLLSYFHELKHINEDDFNFNGNICVLEMNAHNKN